MADYLLKYARKELKKMKKIKSLVCILMTIMLVASCFVMSVSALNPETKAVTLHITKYQIKQMNGETDKVGTTDTLTGTTADAPENATVLEGAEFTIFKLCALGGAYLSDTDIATIDASYDSTANSITYNGNQIVGTTKTTDTNGKADFTIEGADQGIYFVKETKSPENVTATASSFIVNLPMSGTDGYIYDVYVYPKNYTTLGGGILQKTDSDDNVKLSGAKFALYNSSDNQVTEDYYKNAIGDDTNHYLTTDENGYIYVNNLPAGSYYFQETVAPDGYILKSDKYYFTVESGKSTEVVKSGDTYTYDGITLLTADNSSKPGVVKYVTEEGRKVDSVSFGELIRWTVIADVPSDMGTAYKKYTITNTMDSELSFAANSVSVLASLDGTNYESMPDYAYTISAVEGNVFSIVFTDFTTLSTVKKIKIVYKTRLNEATTVMGDDIFSNVALEYKTDVIDETVRENNPPSVYTGGLKFKLVSAKDNSTGLAGAKFDVYTSDHNILVGTVTSSSDGTFEVKGLTAGDYYLVEKETADGYEFVTNKINFTVTKSSYDNPLPLNIINSPNPKLPITGGMGTTAFTVVGLVLIGLSAVFFTASKKAKRAN